MPLLDKVQGGGGPGPSPTAPSPAPGSAAPMQGEGGGAPVPETAGGLSEEQQDNQLGEFLDNAYILMYGGESPDGDPSPDVIQALSAANGEGGQTGGSTPPGGEAGGGAEGGAASAPGADAIQVLAATASTIGAAVTSSASEQGVQLDGAGVVIPGTVSLVEDLADIAQKEGIHDYSDEELAGAAMQSAEMVFEQTKEIAIYNQEEFDEGVQQLLANKDASAEGEMPPGPGPGPGAGGGAPPPPGGMAA